MQSNQGSVQSICVVRKFQNKKHLKINDLVRKLLKYFTYLLVEFVFPSFVVYL